MAEQVLYDLWVDEGEPGVGLGVTGRRVFYLSKAASAKIEDFAKTHELSLLNAARCLSKGSKSPKGHPWYVTRIAPHKEPDYSPSVNEVKFWKWLGKD